MPANKKYLTTSPWKKAGKLTAAILGSLVASICFYLALAGWLDKATVWATAMYTFFLLWCALMCISYWVRKVWHIWGLLLLFTAICVAFIYLSYVLKPLYE